MKNFYIITNPEKDTSLTFTSRINSYLNGKGAKCRIWIRDKLASGLDSKDIPPIPREAQCVIVLGGDGTLLRAAHDLIDCGLPFVGVNLGTLGYLAEVETAALDEALDAIAEDNFEIEERMVLSGQIWRDSHMIAAGEAINDISIVRTGIARTIPIKLSVNDRFLHTYIADGMVVSTPTGSTGYSLSAGGPIVSPRANTLLVTPICSHSLYSGAMVLPPDDDIELILDDGKKPCDAITHFDGNFSMELKVGDSIKISRSDKTFLMVRLNPESFLQTLHNKFSKLT